MKTSYVGKSMYMWAAGWALVACGSNNNDTNATNASASTSATTITPTSSGSATTTTGSTGSSATAASTATTDADTGIRFDMGDPTTTGVESCDCSAGWSYVWIANTSEHTVSKINTRTLNEDGRYYTRPDEQGSPSRTSVSVDGAAVVVANRHGGITKIWAREGFCQDTGGSAGIDTSTGAGDVKTWGEDECVAWHTSFDSLSGLPAMTTQRPVQWTSGVLNEATCRYEDQKIWTVTAAAGEPGFCGTGGVWAHLVNGDTGAVEQTVHISEVECSVAPVHRGPYGAAVDADNNLWFVVQGKQNLIRVDFQTKLHTVYDTPHRAYGIFVGASGDIWINEASGTGAAGKTLSRFNPSTTMWTSIDGVGGQGGITQDEQGILWTADRDDGVVRVDPGANTSLGLVAVPGVSLVKGVAVDVDGFVWITRLADDVAHKFDPTTAMYLDTVTGLTNPYTYSDMAGGALRNSACAQ